MTEAQLLTAVRQLARYRGWMTYHTRDSRGSEAGFPDLVMVSPKQRRIVYAELKTATGKTSAAQDEWLAALAAAGAEVYLWRPADLQQVIPTVLGGGTVSRNRERTDRERNPVVAEDRGRNRAASAFLCQSDRGRRPAVLEGTTKPKERKP